MMTSMTMSKTSMATASMTPPPVPAGKVLLEQVADGDDVEAGGGQVDSSDGSMRWVPPAPAPAPAGPPGVAWEVRRAPSHTPLRIARSSAARAVVG